ncbi:MAG: hypothetical protein HOP13_19055 [Alphaproteobacteria bacterium]|nr:hypothetical protein [Alphaproteobacteria bacterium]
MINLLIRAASLAIGILFAVETSLAREVLVPLAECPEEESGETCDTGGLAWYGPASKIPLRREPRAKAVIKQFLVTGQLNGGRAKPYALTFSQLLTDYFAPTNRSGPIAYEIASRGERYLAVRTNRGSLRVLSNFGIEPPPHIVVIDERSWDVIARYYSPCVDLSFLKRAKQLWDEGRGLCVSLPGQRHPFAKGCTKPTRVDTCSPFTVPNWFVPAKGTRLESIDAAVRDFRTLRLNANDAEGTHFGGSGWGVRAYRVTGTPYLVLRGLCGDCDE